eukprot:gb/GECG01015341.1/.p1 GENE.gb/GECG01015341.1/~~gb/GECG01015341.1/.p1  ORF type:complete len:461 (+),score=48.85 gb/GECG01015341.1/:1-1383(+)
METPSPQRPQTSKGLVRSTASRYFQYPNRVVVDRQTLHRQHGRAETPSLRMLSASSPSSSSSDADTQSTFDRRGDTQKIDFASRTRGDRGMGKHFGLSIGQGTRLNYLAEIGVGTGKDPNELHLHHVEDPDIDVPTSPLKAEEIPEENPAKFEPIYRPPLRHEGILTEEERNRQETLFHLSHYPEVSHTQQHEQSEHMFTDRSESTNKRPATLGDIPRPHTGFKSKKDKLFESFLTKPTSRRAGTNFPKVTRPKSAHFGNPPSPILRTSGAWKSYAWWPTSLHKNAGTGGWGTSIADFRKALSTAHAGRGSRASEQSELSEDMSNTTGTLQEATGPNEEFITYVPSPVDQRIADTFLSTKDELASHGCIPEGSGEWTNTKYEPQWSARQHIVSPTGRRVAFTVAPKNSPYVYTRRDRQHQENKTLEKVEAHMQKLRHLRVKTTYDSVFQYSQKGRLQPAV